MARFFVQLIKRVVEKEDVFTECLAAALHEDRELAQRLLFTLCGKRLDGHDLRTARIEVSTQRSFPATLTVPACCVDMVFTLDRTMTIGVENKLFAEQGENQLQKYLSLELGRVAYIRAQQAEVNDDVYDNSRYLRPNHRRHFLWSDFYADVEACARNTSSPGLTKSLHELFRHYGFDPPLPSIGDLKHADKNVRDANRRNFAKLWEFARAGLRNMGWRRISAGSIAELYLNEGPSRRVKQVWVDPTWSPGLLRVRLTPYAGTQAELAEALRDADLPHQDDVDVQLGQEPKRIRDPEYIQVTISLRKLLGEATEPDAMKHRLAGFVLAVIRAAG